MPYSPFGAIFNGNFNGASLNPVRPFSEKLSNFDQNFKLTGQRKVGLNISNFILLEMLIYFHWIW